MSKYLVSQMGKLSYQVVLNENVARLSLVEILQEAGFLRDVHAISLDEQHAFSIVIQENVAAELMIDVGRLGISSMILECKVLANAQLHCLISEIENLSMLFVDEQERKAAGFVSSARNVNHKININLAGAGSDAVVEGAYLATGKDRYAITTLQQHDMPDSTSRITIKGVAADHALIKSNNLTKVVKNAQRVRTEQVNKNILLSRTARAVSIPMLEVEADDVSCIHGAAVSQIDSEQLFYFQSRGIGLIQARQMMIQGFLL